MRPDVKRLDASASHGRTQASLTLHNLFARDSEHSANTEKQENIR